MRGKHTSRVIDICYTIVYSKSSHGSTYFTNVHTQKIHLSKRARRGSSIHINIHMLIALRLNRAKCICTKYIYNHKGVLWELGGGDDNVCSMTFDDDDDARNVCGWCMCKKFSRLWFLVCLRHAYRRECSAWIILIGYFCSNEKLSII